MYFKIVIAIFLILKIGKSLTDNSQSSVAPDEQCMTQSIARESDEGNVVDLHHMSVVEGRDYPWMALIEYANIRNTSHRGYNCSGTLINSHYILTAAHCVSNTQWKPTRIWLGQWDSNYDMDCLITHESKPNCLSTPKVVVSEIAHIIIHKNYKYPKGLHHDVALIRLQKQIQFSNYIHPICLPSADIINTSNWTNFVAEYISWGSKSRDEGIVARAKLKMPLRIWNTNGCRTRYRIIGRDINKKYELCSRGEQGVDTCHGDSGGALMYSRVSDNNKVYFIIGVMVAGTEECGLQGWPSISIHVQSHLSWIQWNIK